MKRLVGAPGLGLWLWASLARAQADGSFHLDYEAPPQCPTASAFAAKIEGHTPLARLAAAEPAARRFRAVFDTSGPAARGRLEIVDVDGSASLREVEGRDCNEVADALALIAAIVIDPNARPPADQPPDRSAPRRFEEVELPPPIPEPKRVPRVAPQKEPLALRLGLIFQAGVVSEQLVPQVGTVLAYGVEALLDREEPFAPTLRVSIYRISSDEISIAAGKARFEWTAARLGACPVVWSAGIFGFRPCAIADLGSVTGVGYETIDGDEHTLFWAALGAAGRAEALFQNTLLLELEAGALFPLSSQGFRFDPSFEVYRIGPGVYALGGIGFRFL